VGDATAPPMRPASFDHVLVDAPCSGLGVLRRRADARWRVQPADPGQLGALARRMLAAAATLVGSGGSLTYSVCTMTREETIEVDEWASVSLDGLGLIDPPGPPWRPHGRGAVLLPHDADTDGMYLLRLVRP